MPLAQANGIEIDYETFGNSTDTPLLLVMGLGAQMIFWEDEFCSSLARKGHFVIRFDNRDCGMSSWLEELGTPDVGQAYRDLLAGKTIKPPYTLDDMANDCICLLDTLGYDRAHFVGASMGGMIVQTIAYRYRPRVLSVTSIMSSTGNPQLPQGEPRALAAIFQTPVDTREEYVDAAVETSKIIGSPGFSWDEDRIRKRSMLSWDRGHTPQGVARQLTAILAHGDRRSSLALVDVPFLVIHGLEDPLIPVEAGKDTAANVSGSKLVLIEGLGHDLPIDAWPQIIDPICNLTATAENNY